MFVKEKFPPYINPFTDLVKQHEYFKLDLDSRNEEVIVIITHDLIGVEKAPPATVQAGKSEPLNTVKRKLSLTQIDFRGELPKELKKPIMMLKKLEWILQK